MERKQKIVYVITKSAWGGAQRYVYDLATRLRPEDFDIAVYCGGVGPLAKKLAAEGTRAISLPRLERDIKPGRELIALFELVQLFRRERPDVIHLSSSKAGGLGTVAAFAAKLLTLNPFDKLRAGFKPLIVFTVHGWPFREDRPAWQRILIFLSSWLSTVLTDRVIVIDAADYRAARRFIPESKLVLIPHGIAPPDFLSSAEARTVLASHIGGVAGAGTILVGTVAELTRNKGIRYLIDAAHRIKLKIQDSRFNIQVVVMGEGEERPILEREIERAGLADTIFLVGFVPDAGRYLKGLDLFVLPSVKEGLPYVVMEAMSAGLAVIATAVGGVPDLIRHGETGVLVPPKDPAALARAIADLALNPAKRRELAFAARARARERFLIEPMVERTRAVYAMGATRDA